MDGRGYYALLLYRILPGGRKESADPLGGAGIQREKGKKE